MNREQKLKRLELENEQLSDKNVFFDGKLYKISYYSMINIYADEYVLDDELILNTDMTLLSYGSFKTYRHFSSEFKDDMKPTRINYNSFCGYTVINEDINNIYFIDNIKYNNYYESEFYDEKPMIKLKNEFYKLIYNMVYGPLSLINNEYNKKIRIEQLKKHFLNYTYVLKIPEYILRNIFNKMKDEYTSLNINFYDEYFKLYDEYKIL